MSIAGAVVSVTALLSAKSDLTQARGLDKIVALANLCFAAPLAVFGAEHLSDARTIMPLVPAYMPWRLFWTYFVGVALIAASLSIATKIQVRWSGLLFGMMMLSFEAMLNLPGLYANPHDRFAWAYLFREPAFAGGAWILAGAAMGGGSKPGKILISIGRLLIASAAIFYGIMHFPHPLGLPGLPLEKQMPAWIPVRPLIGYLTGAVLLVAGLGILLNRKTRIAATYLGTWIVLLVLVVYGPVLVAALADPSTAVKVGGLNYFFDTLLFGGAILALASAAPHAD